MIESIANVIMLRGYGCIIENNNKVINIYQERGFQQIATNRHYNCVHKDDDTMNAPSFEIIVKRASSIAHLAYANSTTFELFKGRFVMGLDGFHHTPIRIDMQDPQSLPVLFQHLNEWNKERYGEGG